MNINLRYELRSFKEKIYLQIPTIKNELVFIEDDIKDLKECIQQIKYYFKKNIDNESICEAYVQFTFENKLHKYKLI